MARELLLGIAVVLVSFSASSSAIHTAHLDALKSELSMREGALTGDLDKEQKKEKKAYLSSMKLCSGSSDSLAGDVKTARKVIGKLKKLLLVDPALTDLAATALNGLAGDTQAVLDAVQDRLDGAPDGKKKAKAQSALDAANGLLATSMPALGKVAGVDLKTRAKYIGKALKSGQKADKLTAKALEISTGACAFSETWEKGATRTHSCAKVTVDGCWFNGDQKWLMVDPFVYLGCKSLQTAEVLSRGGNKLLKLTSIASDPDCTAGVSMVSIATYPSGLDINPGTRISFRANGELTSASSQFAGSGNYNYDRIRLTIVDANGNTLWYTLEHGDIDVQQRAGFKELFPVPDAEGRYARDLHADFSTIGGFVSGTKIEHIILEVYSVGWVELDDLCVSK